MNFAATPRLPRALLHPIILYERTFARDKGNGGQSKQVDVEKATIMGAILPLSDKDWQRLPEGTFTKSSQKLYTDDPVELKPGQVIKDTNDGQKYTVKTELDHNTIHPMRRYIVEGVAKK